MNRAAAEEAMQAMVECGLRLTRSLQHAKQTASEPDYVAYRDIVARLITDMLVRVMNPIIAEHPDLKPPEMR